MSTRTKRMVGVVVAIVALGVIVLRFRRKRASCPATSR